MLATLLSKSDVTDTVLQSFLASTRKSLDEIEFFAAGEEDSCTPQTREAIARRAAAIRRAAEEVGFGWFAELASALERVFAAGSDISVTEEAMYSALEFLRRSLLLLGIDPVQKKRLPATFPAFLECAAFTLVQNLCGAFSPATGGEAKCIRILVADDEEMVRSFLVDLLRSARHEVFPVENGKAAIACVQTGFFDLVVTDINMPGADGIEVLKCAKAVENVDVDVVIVTGYASVENATEAVRFGAYDYLTKPFDSTADILSVAARAAEHLRLRHHNRRLMRKLQLRNEELNRYVETLEDALAAVEEKRRALIHADRMATLGTLAAGVAHEINNPTTFIRGNLQTMQKFWLSIEPVLRGERPPDECARLPFIIEEMPNLLADMLVGTERINHIVSGLRSFSHQGDGGGRRKPVDIGECLRTALDLVRAQMRHKAELLLEVEEGLPAFVADSQQIVQVFVNLFVNALDAMEGRRDGRLEVSARRDGDEIEVCVRDNGAGMPEEVQAKIFDPFFTTKGIGKGTGLGLSILLGIVRDHGGHVKVESAEGAGTTFRVLLPLGRTARTNIARPRVLIIDDDEGQAAALGIFLREIEEWNVDIAATGGEGLARIGEARPDAVILDIRLPDMDGFEILQRLRENPATRGIAVIVLTGMQSDGMRTRLDELGAEGVLFKPVRPAEIAERIRRLGDRQPGGHRIAQ